MAICSGGLFESARFVTCVLYIVGVDFINPDSRLFRGVKLPVVRNNNDADRGGVEMELNDSRVAQATTLTFHV